MFPLFANLPFIKKDGSRTTLGDAISQGGGSYTLPTASDSTKGGIKVGSGLKMTGEVLSADLPTASAETLGCVKVGSGLSITDGVLSAAGGGGGGLSIVDIDTYQAYDGGASTFKQIGLAALISETDYNAHLSGKTILAINVIDNPKIHIMGISGTTLSNIKMGYFADSPSAITQGTTFRFLVANNPA